MTIQVPTAGVLSNGAVSQSVQPAPAAPETPPQNLSDLLVAYLELLGVEYVFGVPGGHNSAIYEALERSARRGGPRAILSRHESGAVNMADGYTRETGRLGVCTATTGPGSTNLLTGVASAYTDHTPLLLLTGQTLLPEFGAASFQESSPDMMDTAGMLAHCTHYSTVITHPKQFERKLMTALQHALRTPGPVHLSIPVDLSRAPMPGGMSYPNLPALLQSPASILDSTAFESLWQQIVATLRGGNRIALHVGHSCDGATEAITSFAELVNAPITTTQRGKRWIDSYHPLAQGVFGYAGHQSARAALTDPATALILSAGTGLGQWPTSTWDAALLNDRLVHIHPDNHYFTRSPMARLHVQAEVRHCFEELINRVEALQRDGQLPLPPSAPAERSAPDYRTPPPQIALREPENYHNAAAPIHPQSLVWALMQGLPEESRVLVDTSNWLPWTIQYFFSRQHRNYRHSAELAAMGWAIGAAVGTALAAPGTPVVCLTGDGCFLMSGQEITVAVEEQLPVVYIILNDAGYGMVNHRHRQVSKQPIHFGFQRADFALLAQALGAQGYTVRSIDDFRALDFAALCRRPGPTVIDVHIDPEAVPPMGMF
ncbi:MAG: thiamine pyrophosphate-binding protein [Chloroflexi bacterium]|nr:thiamine pyrophosphate-binding protein [Chloroflexota bacterium]